MYLCPWAYVFVLLPMCLCMFVCLCVNTCEHMHMCVSVSIAVYLCLSGYLCSCVCVCVSMCLFLYFCIMGTSAGVSLSLCLRCLCPLLFRSLLILAHKNRLSPSLRNSVSRWVAWNQPLWKYLHHRNWQMLPVSTTPTKSPQPKHYQHFPAYHDPRLVVPKVAVEASLLKFLKL